VNVTTKVVLSVFSTVLFILAACMLAATIAFAWLYGTQRNPEGFVESSEVSMSTDGYAITSTDLDLGSIPDEWLPSNIVGTFQVRARSENGSTLFVGVGPSSDVGDFLADVAHAEVTRFGNQQRLSNTEHAGSVSPQPPADLGFWTVSSEGAGQQTLDWEPESGDWTLVVMNSDAASGLDVSASLGVNTPWIPIGMWVTGVLTVLIAAGAVVIAVLASRQSATVDASDTESPEPASLSS
jgi:preprotein translocase subunit SecG